MRARTTCADCHGFLAMIRARDPKGVAKVLHKEERLKQGSYPFSETNFQDFSSIQKYFVQGSKSTLSIFKLLDLPI